MRRRHLTLAVVGLLAVLLLLVACGGDDDADASPVEAATEEAASEPAAAEPPAEPAPEPAAEPDQPAQTDAEAEAAGEDIYADAKSRLAEAAEEPAVAFTVAEDVAYTSTQTLDVYSPVEEGPWPIVVVLHGAPGSRAEAVPMTEALVKEGRVVYNATWRVQWTDRNDGREYVQSAEDVACAVRFARATGAEYGGDPDRLVLVGFDAGGGIGSLVALAGDEFEGDCVVTEGSALPDAFVGTGGVYDYPLRQAYYVQAAAPKRWERVNPYTHVGSNPELPVVIIHGENDNWVPMKVSTDFADALSEAGYDVTMVVAEKTAHTSSFLPHHVGGLATLEAAVRLAEG